MQHESFSSIGLVKLVYDAIKSECRCDGLVFGPAVLWSRFVERIGHPRSGPLYVGRGHYNDVFEDFAVGLYDVVCGTNPGLLLNVLVCGLFIAASSATLVCTMLSIYWPFADTKAPLSSCCLGVFSASSDY